MTLAAGTKFGSYEVLSPIGSGGMGEVYRARDTKLNRDVALKVLPEAFARNAERMARFRREAQVLASLNHPNIATIYGLEESNGHCALVMELVEGQTLAERIGRRALTLSPSPGGRGESKTEGLPSPSGPSGRGWSRSAGPGEGDGPGIALDESLHIAKQIAEGLEYAHERGIIHRDLKPANVKVRPDGTVKILDFGLAKALEETPAAGGISDSPTISAAATREGIILGTAAYMSPEQARGKTVDRRCDIWSFGAVLFEMLSGKQAFAGEDVSHTLAAVIMKEPNWEALPVTTPATIQRLVRRCLNKDPRQRLRDIGDARIAIEETLSGSSDVGAGLVPAPGRPQGSPLQRALPWALAAVFFLGAIGSSVSYWRLARTPAPAILAEVVPPEGAQFNFLGLACGPPALSPDGRTLAFSAMDASGKTMLWVRSLHSSAAQPLAGTEGALFPFWSADSRVLGFVADGKLKTIEASGALTVVLADASAFGGGSCNRDGTVLFVPDFRKGLYRVADSGGAPLPVITVDASKYSGFLWPVFLPDGKHFLYAADAADPALAGTYYTSLDGKENRLLLRTPSKAVYASGFLLYLRDGTLTAQGFDPERGLLKGSPQFVAERVLESYGHGVFDASGNGVLIYVKGTGTVGGRRLKWFDRAGTELDFIGETGAYCDVRLSPDGRKLAFNAGDPNSEIWAHDLARGVAMRLTIDPDTDHGVPVWSPDGSRILFGALTGKARKGIYQKPSNGAGAEELLLASETADTYIYPTSWSSDGKFILYARGDPGILLQGDIWILPLAGDRKPRLFVQAPAAAYDGQFSPDVRWVAYTSKESGREEVYVVPFDAAKVLNTSPGPAGASAGGRWLISANGGHSPRWRKDGKEIFYLSPDNQMMAAAVTEHDNIIEVQTAHPLFRTMVATFSSPYDVTPDGKKFVINTLNVQNTPLTLVVNWTASLKMQ